MKKLQVFLLLLAAVLLCSACGKQPEESFAPEISEPPSSVSETESSKAESSVSEASPKSESSEEPSEISVSSEESKSPAEDGPKVTDVDYKTCWELYLFHPEQLTYAYVTSHISALYIDGQKNPVIEALNALPLLPNYDGEAPKNTTVGFLFYDTEAKKKQYNLSPGCLTVDGVPYALTDEQYINLTAVAAETAKQESPRAQWAIYMNPARVIDVIFSDNLKDPGAPFSSPSEINRELVAAEMKHIDVSGGKTYTPGSVDFTKLSGVKTLLTFDNGVVYTFVLTNSEMFLESSDMSYACRYKTGGESVLSSYLQYLQDAQSGVMNPMTGKPVIYLYPEKTRDVSVKLDFKGQLCYTYPAYNGGWNVAASPDGTLINKADGSTHYYLFWDGNAYFNDWDFSTGFVVKGDEFESFLKEKLPALGLTPREYNDFITYWVPILSKNKYNLITFATAQYEAIAPLAVIPAPDTVLRVHMVYKAIDEPVDIKEQALPKPPARNGFTLVEWGATRAR